MNRSKKILLILAALALGSQAFAVGPTTMDGVAALGDGYITTATTTAVGAAILAFGWVGFRIVKKYTKGVLST